MNELEHQDHTRALYIFISGKASGASFEDDALRSQWGPPTGAYNVLSLH